jgi:hypothetical protein
MRGVMSIDFWLALLGDGGMRGAMSIDFRPALLGDGGILGGESLLSFSDKEIGGFRVGDFGSTLGSSSERSYSPQLSLETSSLSNILANFGADCDSM